MAEFELARSTTIDAPASVIYPLIGNFHESQQWSLQGRPGSAVPQAVRGAQHDDEKGLAALKSAAEGAKA